MQFEKKAGRCEVKEEEAVCLGIFISLPHSRPSSRTSHPVTPEMHLWRQASSV